MSRSNIRRHLCHVATYLVAIELPTLYLPRATVGIARLFSRACPWLFEGPHSVVDGGCRVQVHGVAAVGGDTISLVVPATKLLLAKAVEAACCAPCARYLTASGECGVPFLARHLKVLLLSLLCSSRCGKPGAFGLRVRRSSGYGKKSPRRCRCMRSARILT